MASFPSLLVAFSAWHRLRVFALFFFFFALLLVGTLVSRASERLFSFEQGWFCVSFASVGLVSWTLDKSMLMGDVSPRGVHIMGLCLLSFEYTLYPMMQGPLGDILLEMISRRI